MNTKLILFKAQSIGIKILKCVISSQYFYRQFSMVSVELNVMIGLIDQLAYPIILNVDWSKITIQKSQGHASRPLYSHKLNTIN